MLVYSLASVGPILKTRQSAQRSSVFTSCPRHVQRPCLYLHAPLSATPLFFFVPSPPPCCSSSSYLSGTLSRMFLYFRIFVGLIHPRVRRAAHYISARLRRGVTAAKLPRIIVTAWWSSFNLIIHTTAFAAFYTLLLYYTLAALSPHSHSYVVHPFSDTIFLTLFYNVCSARKFTRNCRIPARSAYHLHYHFTYTNVRLFASNSARSRTFNFTAHQHRGERQRVQLSLMRIYFGEQKWRVKFLKGEENKMTQLCMKWALAECIFVYVI